MSSPPKVLCISSQVAVGLVGNSVMTPALLSLGVMPIALPTILLSQQPGLGPPEKLAMPATRLGAMLDRLADLGFLADVAVMVTGYFGETAQVDAVREFVARLKTLRPDAVFLCDPVIGDSHTGLYVRPEIGKAVRDVLVPVADMLTPNAFELGWLTGMPVTDLDSARKATAGLFGKEVVVTSIPDGPDRLSTAIIRNGEVFSITRPRVDDVPHGTGDLLAGLLAGYLAKGIAPRESLARVIEAVERAISVSAGKPEIDLARGLGSLG